MNLIDKHIKCFLRDSQDCRGVAAMEFAIVLPFLLMVFLGGAEASRYFLIHQKAEKLAYTVADVITQSKSLTNAQIAQTLTVSSQLMQPFTFDDDGVVILTSVYQSGVINPPSVNWQYVGGGTLSRTSKIGVPNYYATLPGGLSLADKDNVIIAEVYYRYKPLFGSAAFAEKDLYKTVIFKPRLGNLTTPPT